MCNYEVSLDFSSSHPIYIAYVSAKKKEEARLMGIDKITEVLKSDGINFNFEQDLSGSLLVERMNKKLTF